MPKTQSLASLVIKARTALGWSQETLATNSGVTFSTIQKIEQAVVLEPKTATLLKLERALGVPLIRREA